MAEVHDEKSCKHMMSYFADGFGLMNPVIQEPFHTKTATSVVARVGSTFHWRVHAPTQNTNRKLSAERGRAVREKCPRVGMREGHTPPSDFFAKIGGFFKCPADGASMSGTTSEGY